MRLMSSMLLLAVAGDDSCGDMIMSSATNNGRQSKVNLM